MQLTHLVQARSVVSGGRQKAKNRKWLSRPLTSILWPICFSPVLAADISSTKGMPTSQIANKSQSKPSDLGARPSRPGWMFQGYGGGNWQYPKEASWKKGLMGGARVFCPLYTHPAGNLSVYLEGDYTASPYQYGDHLSGGGGVFYASSKGWAIKGGLLGGCGFFNPLQMPAFTGMVEMANTCLRGGLLFRWGPDFSPRSDNMASATLMRVYGKYNIPRCERVMFVGGLDWSLAAEATVIPSDMGGVEAQKPLGVYVGTEINLLPWVSFFIHFHQPICNKPSQFNQGNSYIDADKLTFRNVRAGLKFNARKGNAAGLAAGWKLAGQRSKLNSLMLEPVSGFENGIFLRKATTKPSSASTGRGLASGSVESLNTNQTNNGSGDQFRRFTQKHSRNNPYSRSTTNLAGDGILPVTVTLEKLNQCAPKQDGKAAVIRVTGGKISDNISNVDTQSSSFGLQGKSGALELFIKKDQLTPGMLVPITDFDTGGSSPSYPLTFMDIPEDLELSEYLENLHQKYQLTVTPQQDFSALKANSLTPPSGEEWALEDNMHLFVVEISQRNTVIAGKTTVTYPERGLPTGLLFSDQNDRKFLDPANYADLEVYNNASQAWELVEGPLYVGILNAPETRSKNQLCVLLRRINGRTTMPTPTAIYAFGEKESAAHFGESDEVTLNEWKLLDLTFPGSAGTEMASVAATIHLPNDWQVDVAQTDTTPTTLDGTVRYIATGNAVPSSLFSVSSEGKSATLYMGTVDATKRQLITHENLTPYLSVTSKNGAYVSAIPKGLVTNLGTSYLYRANSNWSQLALVKPIASELATAYSEIQDLCNSLNCVAQPMTQGELKDLISFAGPLSAQTRYTAIEPVKSLSADQSNAARNGTIAWLIEEQGSVWTLQGFAADPSDKTQLVAVNLITGDPVSVVDINPQATGTAQDLDNAKGLICVKLSPKPAVFSGVRQGQSFRLLRTNRRAGG